MKKLLSLTVALVMIMAVLPTAGILVSAAGIDSVEVSTAPTGLEALSIEGTETLYDDFADDYDDPNWVTDEQLFGVWDSATEIWTTESLLNYEKYSEELGEVEEAVKAGAHAGNILKQVAKIAGGGGGGRPDSATAGGKDPSKLEEALEAVNNIVASMLK